MRSTSGVGCSAACARPLEPVSDQRARSKTLAYSVVLVTKDRKTRAERTIENALAQTRAPNAVVVVDSSDPSLELDPDLEQAALSVGCDLHLLRSEPSITAQRNRGVDHVSTPVVLMLDDDIVIAPDYMEVILRRWEWAGLEAFAAVVGMQRLAPGQTPMPRPELLIRRALLLHEQVYGGSYTVIKRSGKVRIAHWPDQEVFVPVFANSAVVYRTELLRKHRFDERFSGYVLGEDYDLTARLARDGPILHTPATWSMHDHAPGGRPQEDLWSRKSREEVYFRLRRIDRSPASLAAFAVSIAAEVAQAAAVSFRYRNLRALTNYVRGLRETLHEAVAERLPR
jgi:glycosyltransferase involved in cell wall biosynthesis